MKITPQNIAAARKHPDWRIRREAAREDRINGDPVSWCRDDPHPEVRKQLLWASGPSTPLDKILEHRGAGKFTGDGLLPAVGADNHTYRTYQSREEREHQIREQRQSRAYHQNLREANWG